jgi:hypothetical protein
VFSFLLRVTDTAALREEIMVGATFLLFRDVGQVLGSLVRAAQRRFHCTPHLSFASQKTLRTVNESIEILAVNPPLLSVVQLDNRQYASVD